MTDPEPLPAPVDTWDSVLAALRRRYPGQKDSVLFCIHKLQQNPDLTLRDFRAEADLHRIPMAGRALHSARVLLGLPGGAKPSPAPTPARAARRDPVADDGGSIENRVVAAVRQIQDAAGAESERMRGAIQQAIAILQRALGDRKN